MDKIFEALTLVIKAADLIRDQGNHGKVMDSLRLAAHDIKEDLQYGIEF